MKRIININTPEIPCPGSHHHTSTKLCKGFEQNGFEYIEINSISDIEKYNGPGNFFLISNHFTTDGDKNAVYSIGSKLKDSNFICWHFNAEPDILTNMPFEKYIVTGEYYRKEPTYSKGHMASYNRAMSLDEWVPFVFSSSLHPDDVGKLEKNIIYDSIFVGYPYKKDWVSSLDRCFSYFSNAESNFISEEDRVNAYLSSRVCLGFHSEANIKNNCIVERVFEGMSYGCAVISDNESAEELTNGIVKKVSSLEETRYYVDLYRENTELFKDVQEKGYEFIKREGTYYHLAQKMVSKLESLY